MKFIKQNISPYLILLSFLSGMVMWKKFQSKHNLQWQYNTGYKKDIQKIYFTIKDTEEINTLYYLYTDNRQYPLPNNVDYEEVWTE
jgi:hypothetical protein